MNPSTLARSAHSFRSSALLGVGPSGATEEPSDGSRRADLLGRRTASARVLGRAIGASLARSRESLTWTSRCEDAPMETSSSSFELTLVQPRSWQADGDANFAQLDRQLDGIRPRTSEAAVVVLPELVGSSMARTNYCSAVSRLATRLDRWVIGGSHHWERDGQLRNAGVVAAPTGEIVAAYEKRHPFGAEIDSDVGSGDGPVVFDVNGVSVAAMVCADFWHSECVQRLDPHPDVIAVASFSISRGRSPGPRRSSGATSR